MQSSHQILIFGPEGEILARYPSNDMERAYQHCLELEEMGIEVKMQAPSLPESLAGALGRPSEERDRIRKEIDQEIAQHID